MKKGQYKGLNPDQRRRVEDLEKRREDREQRKAQREEVEREEVNPNQDKWLELALIQKQELIDNHRKDGKVSGKAYPPSVLAVYDLVKALNNVEGTIEPENNAARLSMAKALNEQLTIFLNKLDEAMVYGNEYKPSKHTAARDYFQQQCAEIINRDYKALAAEPTIWNAIKDLFNDVCKAIGFEPKGKYVDSTLDASSVIKNQGIKERFKEVMDSSDQMGIKDEQDIDVTPSGPR
ncbi:TPA: hypothetical protein ACPSKZ_003185 [Legionella anisa]